MPTFLSNLILHKADTEILERRPHGLSTDQDLAKLVFSAAFNLHDDGFLWVQSVNCGGHWDATPRFHQGGLTVPEMVMLSTDGLQLTAPSGTAWAAERHLTQGYTFPQSPHPMTDCGAGIMGLLILPQWGQLWKPLQFPYCLWGRLRPQLGFAFRAWVCWCPPRKQKSPLG